MKISVRIAQEFLWFFFRFYLLLSRSTFRGHVSLKSGYGYIIAANHRSQLDPFVIGAAFPHSVYHRFSPVWFMAYRELFKPPLLRLGLRLSGAFPTKPIHNLPAGLEFSAQVLEQGGTICIFPEGQRAIPGTVEPKRGVSVLAQIDKVELVPVRLDWEKGWLLRKVHIAFGEPMPAAHLSPQQIMQHIYRLETHGEPVPVPVVE
jgi:1-acyl-sn-glycerol-3-phosphate acyltransferase